jgi:peptidoglycan/LPS O-acetylase OafA/YrhL
MIGSLSLGTLHMIFVLVGAASAILAAWLSYEHIEVRLTQWLFRRKK